MLYTKILLFDVFWNGALRFRADLWVYQRPLASVAHAEVVFHLLHSLDITYRVEGIGLWLPAVVPAPPLALRHAPP